MNSVNKVTETSKATRREWASFFAVCLHWGRIVDERRAKAIMEEEKAVGQSQRKDEGKS